MSEENKAIFRSIMDVVNSGNLAKADEVFDANYVENSAAPDQAPGVEGFKQLISMLRSAFPDLHSTVEDLIAEGDKVVGRVTASGTHKGELMGIAPSGNQVTISEIHIIRIAGGKVVEHWGIVDQLGLMQQIGAIPSQ